MKKLIALLMLAACFAWGRSQELTINSIAPAIFDATANSPATERKDLNGELCALIKVQLPLEGAEFLGNTVGETVNHAGEYWVYVIDGTRELHLHQKLVKPLVIYFPDFGIKGVEGGVTYIADLSVPKELWGTAGAAAAPARLTENFLVLNVTPPNAKVFIGGQEKMVSEGICSVLMKAGTHAVRVEASGYQTEEFQATIGDEKVVRDVSLRSTMATLTVRSATSGARIFLNGNAVGTGSWTGSIMPDTYLVELKKEGYRPAERRVTLAMNATETLDFPPMEAITGDLLVSSTPAGAAIELDGRTVGTTPEVLRAIPVGTHTLRLTRSGYQPSTSSVTVTESASASLDLSLTKLPDRPLYGHAKAGHLDLAAERDGQYYFFTESEWNRVPSPEKPRYIKKGIVIRQPSITPPFILALTDNGKNVKWDKAMASGINMPSKTQGEAIVKDCENVKKALKAFGGTGYEGDSLWFWAKDESDSSLALYVGMTYGVVNGATKGDTSRVRAVAPVPVAAM